MTKEQAITDFWNSFGWKAYDENTVPKNAQLPYITFQMVDGVFGDELPMTASLWDRSKNWSTVTDKKDVISVELTLGGKIVPFDGGAVWLKRGSPFAQRMQDPDDSIRRIVLNVSAEFISAH